MEARCESPRKGYGAFKLHGVGYKTLLIRCLACTISTSGYIHNSSEIAYETTKAFMDLVRMIRSECAKQCFSLKALGKSYGLQVIPYRDLECSNEKHWCLRLAQGTKIESLIISMLLLRVEEEDEDNDVDGGGEQTLSA